jgi:adenylate cyclase class 2
MADEVEVKFLVSDVNELERKLHDAGFQQKTPPTFERNTLYDLADRSLRAKGEVLRLRLYGERWKLTHKSKGSEGRHKVRAEHETTVASGGEMDAILKALGYQPVFVYEKHRAEWTDGKGEVVVDRTPIGNLAEIEGTPDWIDRVAASLGVNQKQYITKSYAVLFDDWRSQTRSTAKNMTFEDVKV